MTQAGLDAAEWGLQGHELAVTPEHWGWAAREEKKLWTVMLEKRKVDDVWPSLFGEDENVDGRDIGNLDWEGRGGQHRQDLD